MLTDILRAAAGAVGFMVLDGVWLGLVMSGYYRSQLAAIARLTPDGGGFAPNWAAALMVYVCLGAGIAMFAVPRATDWVGAATYGAALGFVVYGVYDFTNYSTLKDYPLGLTFVDMAWGTFATALCSVFVWSAIR
ncbi:MAG TPA: DUF2177 family protein [Vicinamibacterales bacterium]